MNIERKRNLRALAPIVRRLVKASLLNQAFELEKVIAATFEPSDEFRALMRNIPQNYIETVMESYRKLTYKAWDMGYAKAGSRSDLGKFQALEDEDKLREVRQAFQLSYPMVEDLVQHFKGDVDQFLESVPDLADIYQQFGRDLEKAHVDGALSYMNDNLPAPAPEAEPAVVEEAPKEAPAPAAEPAKEEAAPAESAKPAAEPAPKEPVAASTAVKAGSSISLEDYTKLLGTKEAENVLRYYLGLTPKSVVASYAAASDVEKVGPYSVPDLIEKIKTVVKSHTLSADEQQAVPVECLVADAAEMKDEEVAALLSERLGVAAGTLSDVQIALDEMGVALIAATGLPGELVFMDYGDDYCLVYAFSRDDAHALGLESGAVVSAAKKADGNPQGAMTVDDQKEVEALASIGKSSSLKEIKQASPKVGAYLNNMLTDIRNSKVGVVEGGRVLKANITELVSLVFGHDGAMYLQHLKSKKGW